MANPLLEKFETPFESAPFSKIKNEDYKPAFVQAIEEAKAEIDAITANPEAPTFTNTIEAMELSGEKLGRISSIFFNLNSAETNDEIQEIAQEVSPLLSEFGNDVRLNQDLFERIKVVYNQKDSLNLTDEQAFLLEKTMSASINSFASLGNACGIQPVRITVEFGWFLLNFLMLFLVFWSAVAVTVHELTI